MDPNTLPDTPVGFLTLLFTGAGALFGLCTYWIINVVVTLWEARTGQPISATKKRWVSIFTPAGLVFVGWAGLVAFGQQPATWESFYFACISAVGAVGSKQLPYALAQSASKEPQVVNTTNIGQQTNISQVDAASDVYLGSTHTEEPPDG